MTTGVVLAITDTCACLDTMPVGFFAAAVGSVVNNDPRLAKLSEADKATAAQTRSSVVLLQIRVSILIVGKMLFRAFVAGFSERLIPNALDRLGSQAESLHAMRAAPGRP